MNGSEKGRERVTVKVKVPWPAVGGEDSAGFDTGPIQKKDLDDLNNYVMSLAPCGDFSERLKGVQSGCLTEPQMFELQDEVTRQINGMSLTNLQEFAEVLRKCVPDGVRKPKVREDFEMTGLLWKSFRIPDTRISIDKMVDGRRCIITITDTGVSMYVQCSFEDDLFALYCD